MKKIFLGLVALGMASAAVSPAAAADMAARPYTKAPAPMISPVYDWSGFYVGLNGGGAWSHKCWNNNSVLGVVTNVAEGCQNASGGVAGGQFGFRTQSASWVFGLEAQGDWAGLKGSNTSRFLANTTNESRVNAFGLFTGQVGYAWSNVLWYVKGGGAVVNDRYSGIVTSTGIAIDRLNDARWGAAVGTGVEFAFAPSWSVGFEYDHMFMGNRDVILSGVTSGAPLRSERISQDVDMATVRVNYRWGGPAISKY